MQTANAAPIATQIHFKILSKNGDDRLTWDKRFIEQVHEAREKFYELRKKGYFAYLPGLGGKPSKMITEFDPSAEEVIFHGMVAGG
jgi:hypothetical protein